MKNVRLIGAGAGSGKTYRLSEEVFHGVKSKSIRPEGIMLTTFTKRAASELRGRVGAMLIEQGLVKEAHQLGQSLMGTVHSVCATLLQDYAFECGLSMSQNVIEAEEATRLFRRALASCLSYEEQQQIHNQSQAMGIDDWQEIVKSLVEAIRINNILPTQLAAMGKEVLRRYFEGIRTYKNGLQEFLDAAIVLEKKLRKTIENGTDTIKTTANYLSDLQDAIYEAKKSSTITWSSIQKLHGRKPAVSNPHCQDAVDLGALADTNFTWPEVRQDIEAFITGIYSAAAKSLAAFTQLKQEVEAVDFNDLEVLMLKALDNQLVQERLQERIDVLMVDEFQDTSPLQMAIFVKMAAIIPKVIWVGDPKQAIYGFRGADPDIMLATLDAIPKKQKSERLEYSWRSRPELVSFANDTFKDVFASIGQKPQDVTLNPQRKVELKTKPLESWVLESVPNPSGGRTSQNQDTDCQQVATQIKNVLTAGDHEVIDRYSKKKRAIEPRDIAILVRSNKMAVKLASHLHGYNLPCEVAVAGFLAEPEIRCVLATINLLLQPENRYSQAQLSYLHDVYHLDKKSHEEWMNGLIAADTQRSDELIATIREQAATAQELPILGLFDLAVNLSGSLALTHSRHEPSVAKYNIEQLRHLIEDYLSQQLSRGRPVTMRSALAYLDELANDEEDKVKPLATNAIQILTYHGSKGLEWPMVILFELGKEYDAASFGLRVESPDTIDLSDPLKDRHLVYWPYPYGKSGTGANNPSGLIQKFEGRTHFPKLVQRRREEEQRLLYVALTRPRDYLVFAARPNKLDALDHLIDHKGKVTISIHQDESDAGNQWNVQKPKVSEEVYEFDRTGELQWFSYTAKTDQMPGRIKPSEVNAPSESQSAVTNIVMESYGGIIKVKGTDDYESLGNAVHAYLAIDTEGLTREQCLGLAEGIIAEFGLIGKISHQDLVEQADRFYAMFRKKFPKGLILREVPLHRVQDGVVVQGFADMVVETDAGFVVIDHKTFVGSMEQMLERAQGYAGQLGMYRELVEQGSGKKVVGCWVDFVALGQVCKLIDP